MEVIKILVCSLILFIIATVFSVYMVIYPNNAFDVSFFGAIFETFGISACINIYLIYDIIKRNK